MSMPERRAMIGRDNEKLSISRQCGLLGVSRSSYYHLSKGPSEEDLELMKLIDTEYLKAPFYGSRKMAELLGRLLNRPINRKRVQRLMRLMGIEAIYQKPNTSRPGKGHKIYPYLLKGLEINRPGQVFAADITYSAPGSLCWHGDARRDTSMFGIHMDRARKRYGPSGRSLLRKSVSPSGGDPLYTGGVTQPVGKGA